MTEGVRNKAFCALGWTRCTKTMACPLEARWLQAMLR